MVGLRYAIAKPGVCQLMHNNVDQSAIACQKSGGEEGKAGIFLLFSDKDEEGIEAEM
jgi:hypothetical protein